ncbi:MAG: Type secretion system protein [Betaproteobacteria bacterium]|nr:Type secretion system protein [Betaproteobacteria bacterium]
MSPPSSLLMTLSDSFLKHRPTHCGFVAILAAFAINHAHGAAPVTLEQVSPARTLPAAPAPAGTANRVTGPNDTVTLNFNNAEIEGVVKLVSEITGRNFVLDPRVRGTINIVSSTPLSKALVYEVFLSALRLQGFAVVEDRGITKILPEADAKTQQGPAFGPQDRSRSSGDRIQTQVFVLKYESAAQLLPILRPLIAPGNAIGAYQSGNALVITDYASNLRRIEKIIDAIDQPSRTDGAAIPIRYASALDVAQTINRLFAESAQTQGGAADVTQRVIVVADARSNTLLVRSDNPSQLGKVRNLVGLLDTPTSAGGNMHVVFLKNAEAVKIAETLRAIYSGETSGGQRTGSGGFTPGMASGPPLSATGASPPIASGPGATAASPAPSGAYASPFGSALAPGGSSSGGIVQADAATNSIIITAPDAIYNNLRAVVEKLDVRRAQVYVEALIAEITADTAAEFGIQWQSLSGAGTGNTGTRLFGGTNLGGAGQNILGIAQNPTTAGRGLNIGVINGRVSIPGVGEILNLGVLVRALATENNANILSTPTLLTLDNEEARIIVGQNVPFITGQYALSGAATTPTPFQTIERRDVGLTLRIRPHISEGGTVRMQIFQEVSSIEDRTNPAGVITNKRAVESTVLVDDGQIIVIGGLIQDDVRNGTDKVPVLGDIPFVGGLFRYRTRSRSKTNLMIFLKPTLLRDARSADGVTGSSYDYILREQLQGRPAPSAVLPDMEWPSLRMRMAPPLEVER